MLWIVFVSVSTRNVLESVAMCALWERYYKTGLDPEAFDPCLLSGVHFQIDYVTYIHSRRHFSRLAWCRLRHSRTHEPRRHVVVRRMLRRCGPRFRGRLVCSPWWWQPQDSDRHWQCRTSPSFLAWIKPARSTRTPHVVTPRHRGRGVRRRHRCCAGCGGGG